MIKYKTKNRHFQKNFGRLKKKCDTLEAHIAQTMIMKHLKLINDEKSSWIYFLKFLEK